MKHLRMPLGLSRVIFDNTGAAILFRSDYVTEEMCEEVVIACNLHDKVMGILECREVLMLFEENGETRFPWCHVVAVFQKNGFDPRECRSFKAAINTLDVDSIAALRQARRGSFGDQATS